MKLFGRILLDIILIVGTLILAFAGTVVTYTYTQNSPLSLVVFFVLLIGIPYGLMLITNKHRNPDEVAQELTSYQKWGPKFVWGCIIIIGIIEVFIYAFNGKF